MRRFATVGRPLWLATAFALNQGSVPAAANPAKMKPATILTEQSRGLVMAKVGVPVEIRLQAQAGTGFSWVSTRSTDVLTEKKPLRASKALPGGTQVQRFQFLAKRPGTYLLSFSYQQPWRGGTKGARTKTFTIIAR
jgi:hypothetical protein